MASPGAGKTSLIEQTLPRLAGQLRVAVVDGDIATSIDADRAAAAGAGPPSRSTPAANVTSTRSCCAARSTNSISLNSIC